MIENDVRGIKITKVINFRIGERVEHHTYGVGRVVRWNYQISASGTDEPIEKLTITINTDKENRYRLCFPEDLMAFPEDL